MHTHDFFNQSVIEPENTKEAIEEDANFPSNIVSTTFDVKPRQPKTAGILSPAIRMQPAVTGNTLHFASDTIS